MASPAYAAGLSARQGISGDMDIWTGTGRGNQHYVGWAREYDGRWEGAATDGPRAADGQPRVYHAADLETLLRRIAASRRRESGESR